MMKKQKKRRKKKKTDNKARMALLKSGMPRIVVRKTNKYIIIQAVETQEAQDKILTGVSSRELLKKGWDEKYKGSLKSVPAAYLTGLMTAKKIKNKKFILDIGLAFHSPKNRIYAAVKGLVDGGVDIRIDKNVFPSQERTQGQHLKQELKLIITKVKSNIENG